MKMKCKYCGGDMWLFGYGKGWKEYACKECRLTELVSDKDEDE